MSSLIKISKMTLINSNVNLEIFLIRMIFHLKPTNLKYLIKLTNNKINMIKNQLDKQMICKMMIKYLNLKMHNILLRDMIKGMILKNQNH